MTDSINNPQNSPVEQLAILLEQTGKAHHEAFRATDGQDENWPAWYAEYLQGRLDEFVSHPPSQDELTALIEETERERGDTSGTPWPEVYARAIMAAYNTPAS